MALRTILVPTDGSAPAEAMLRLACAVAGGHGRVLVLATTRIPAAIPLDPLPGWVDAAADTALDRAEQMAAEWGVAIELWLARARREADAIAGEAAVQEVDAVFLPLWSWAHPWRRLRTAWTARTVRQRVACAVLRGTWDQGLGRNGGQCRAAAVRVRALGHALRASLYEPR